MKSPLTFIYCFFFTSCLHAQWLVGLGGGIGSTRFNISTHYSDIRSHWQDTRAYFASLNICYEWPHVMIECAEDICTPLNFYYSYSYFNYSMMNPSSHSGEAYYEGSRSTRFRVILSYKHTVGHVAFRAGIGPFVTHDLYGSTGIESGALNAGWECKLGLGIQTGKRFFISPEVFARHTRYEIGPWSTYNGIYCSIGLKYLVWQPHPREK